MENREELLKVIAELERRNKEKEKDRLSQYNTNPEKLHLKQIEFHKSDKRNRWNFGGNRTGKTVSGAVEAVWYARGNHPYKKVPVPSSGWVVSLTNEVQRDVAQGEILRWLNPDWIKNVGVRKGKSNDLKNAIIDYIEIENILGSVSRIGFKSCDQGREKFQGTSLNWIWFDEEPPKEIYDECLMRIIDTSGDIWGTMTPLKGLTWVYDVVYKNETNNPEIEYRFFSWEDNPYLSKDEIDMLIASLPEKERLSRQYGQFISSSSALFGDFNENFHSTEPFLIPFSWRRYMAVDYGYDMAAALWFAVSEEGTVYCYNEIHIPNLLISEFCEKILEFESIEQIKAGGKIRYVRFCPPDFRKRSHINGETWHRTFMKNGVALRETSNKREYGWACLREMFRIYTDLENEERKYSKLYIFNNCKVLIEHLKKAVADPNKTMDISDKTESEHYITHILDTARYFAVSFYHPASVKKPEKTRIERIKERKVRERIKGYDEFFY